MKTQFIAVSSITYAHKAKEYLLSQGISASIVRTPHDFSDTGCGYSLQVQDNADQIASMLKDAGVKVTAVY